MNKIVLIIVLILIAGGVYFWQLKNKDFLATPIEKPLNKYSFENLRKRKSQNGPIIVGKVIQDHEKFTSKEFVFSSDEKKVSGLINLPKKEGKLPAIVMVRGYVNPEKYFIGEGTEHAAEVFAQNGFITVAPDFLGYGDSDKPPKDPMEERFLTYTTVLDLIESLKSLVNVDASKIGLWGHSNGGQIVLTVLEISSATMPAVLWAPVSKPFPYSILYYTDDIDDHGRALRKIVSDFERNYLSENYSLTNYLSWINSPIQLYQGGVDESVPQKWSDDLYKNLISLNKEIEYFVYPEQDHNFSKASWDGIVSKNIDFYHKSFEK